MTQICVSEYLHRAPRSSERKAAMSEPKGIFAIEEAPGNVPNPLDKPTVAAFSTTQIRDMSRQDMIRAIRACRLPGVGERLGQHLKYYDRSTLQRLLYLARRCCRNQGY